jgi:hypothetical protein
MPGAATGYAGSSCRPVFEPSTDARGPQRRLAHGCARKQNALVGRAISVLVHVTYRGQSEYMTEQKMLEQWLEGCALQRIMFRDGLVLNFADYNELVITVPMRLTLPAIETSPAEAITIDPNDAADQERPLFDFAGAKCIGAVWYDTGDLHLEFSDGHKIDVPPSENATAWELYGKYHGYAACLPNGEMRVVRHDVAETDGDE